MVNHPSVVNKLVNDINAANDTFNVYAESIDDQIAYTPLYANENSQAGIGISISESHWNNHTNSYEGGMFDIYGIAYNNGKRAIDNTAHMCRVGKSGGYNAALLLVGNLIEFINGNELGGTMIGVLPQICNSIALSEKKVGIENSPLRKNFYETIQNQLVQCLIGIERNNYEISSASWYSLGGKLRNILNMDLSSKELEEITNLVNDKRLLPFLKKISTNEELMLYDGINIFPEKLTELIGVLEKTHKTRELNDLIIYKIPKPNITGKKNEFINVELGNCSDLPIFNPDTDFVDPNTDDNIIDENEQTNHDRGIFDPNTDGMFINAETDEEYQEYVDALNPKKPEGKTPKKVECRYCGEKIEEGAFCSFCKSQN